MNLAPTTRNLILLLEEKGIIRIKKDYIKSKYQDEVFKDFFDLCKLYNTIKVFESQDSCEIIVLASSKSIPYTFIV